MCRQEAAAAALSAKEAVRGKVRPPKWKQQSAQLRAAMLAARPGKLREAVAAFPGSVEEDQVALVPSLMGG